MTLNQIQEEIIEEFELFDTWEDKYEYIIDMGKKLKPLQENYKSEVNIIRGCQSKVWLISSLKEGKLVWEADSESLIVKGLLYLLLRVFSNQTPQDIISSEPYFIEKIGMKQHLASTRNNGLLSMIEKIKQVAQQNKP